MRVTKSSAIEAVFVALFALLVLAGLKEFQVWGQVTYIWGSRVNPFLTSPTELGPHGLRYALMYPLLRISEISGIDHDVLFTALTLPSIFVVISTVRRTVTVVTGQRRIKTMFVLLNAVVFLLLFYKMNGRMTLAFLGYSLLIYSLNYVNYIGGNGRGSFVLIFLGLLLCGVSSGTMASSFLVSTTAFVFFLQRELRRLRLSRSKIASVVSIALAAYFFGIFVFIGLMKNLAFFGGGPGAFLQMLKHGAGAVLYPLLQNGMVVAAILVVPVILLMVVLKSRHPFLTIQVILALSCGLFGLSTLTLALIPLLVQIGVKWHSRPRSSRHVAPSGLATVAA